MEVLAAAEVASVVDIVAIGVALGQGKVAEEHMRVA